MIDYTRGPWEVGEFLNDNDIRQVINRGHAVIHRNPDKDFDTLVAITGNRADAQLVALAPEMAGLLADLVFSEDIEAVREEASRIVKVIYGGEVCKTILTS